MDRTQRPVKEPKSCEHFRLLLGAVNLNGLAPQENLFECRPGPDTPYVIARILQMPSMEAVISSIPMDCGYTAFPIVYFSQEPPENGSLTQSWAQKEYYFTSKEGKRGWNIVDDDNDYDLLPWLKKGKLRWLKDGSLSPKGVDVKLFPFSDLKGKQRPQIIIENEHRYE